VSSFVGPGTICAGVDEQLAGSVDGPPETEHKRTRGKSIGGGGAGLRATPGQKGLRKDRRSGRHRHASLKTLRELSLQELSQLRRRPELRDGFQFLEGGCERIGQAPDCASSELHSGFRLHIRFAGPRIDRKGNVRMCYEPHAVDLLQAIGDPNREIRLFPVLHGDHNMVNIVNVSNVSA
jgi:hypothetical protein